MIYTKFECLAMPLKVFVMDIEGSQIKGTAQVSNYVTDLG